MPDYYEIIGHPRDGTSAEVIYRGDDYSAVSDLMPNEGEPDECYAWVECYENGRLIERNQCSDGPVERVSWASVLVLLVIVGMIMMLIATFH